MKIRIDLNNISRSRHDLPESNYFYDFWKNIHKLIKVFPFELVWDSDCEFYLVSRRFNFYYIHLNGYFSIDITLLLYPFLVRLK